VPNYLVCIIPKSDFLQCVHLTKVKKKKECDDHSFYQFQIFTSMHSQTWAINVRKIEFDKYFATK